MINADYRARKVFELLHDGVTSYSSNLDHITVFYGAGLLGFTTRTLSPGYMRVSPNESPDSQYEQDFLNAARLHVKTLREIRNPDKRKEYISRLRDLIQNTTFELPNLAEEGTLRANRGVEDKELPDFWAEVKYRARIGGEYISTESTSQARYTRLISPQTVKIVDDMMAGRLEDIKVEGEYTKKPPPKKYTMAESRREDIARMAQQLRLGAAHMDDDTCNLIVGAMIKWGNEGFKMPFRETAFKTRDNNAVFSSVTDKNLNSALGHIKLLTDEISQSAALWIPTDPPVNPNLQRVVLSAVMESKIIKDRAGDIQMRRVAEFIYPRSQAKDAGKGKN